MPSKTTWKISLAALAVVGIGAGLATWFARTGNAAAGPGAFDVVRLSNTLSDGALIADEQGFFAKHGIRIEWTGKQAHGPAAIIALVAGQNDAAVSISTAMIIARTHGAHLKIVAASNVSRKDVPLFNYLVKDGSPITGKPTDFIGKKVVASPTTIGWYPLVVYLKRGGVDPTQVEFLQLPSPMATEQAFREGKVDVISGSRITPPASKLLAEGGVHTLPGVSDYEVLGIDQIGGWAMREDFIAAHPDIVRRFIAGVTEGYAWGNAHPAEGQEILNRRNEVPQEYRKYQQTWRPAPEDARVDPVSIDKWIAILEEFGQVEPGAVKADEVYTNAYSPLDAKAGTAQR